ncbi:Hypothetical protein GbCGDNIH3_7010 [Granulibacter bethesdensis]|uniref:Uncharacterized protein n=1 Tax=Granulibacter bethesdensis TaxID=364410 RepID=A0AAN0REG7_9PROT|nr:Hypothetical protein GbCGDNIH3_7010 [Granulibacter bethesdensis]
MRRRPGEAERACRFLPPSAAVLRAEIRPNKSKTVASPRGFALDQPVPEPLTRVMTRAGTQKGGRQPCGSLPPSL